MANNIKEINDIVKKCKILLLDIEGTTTSISFVKDKLFPYAEENVKKFLDSQWENGDVKESVNALRKLALEDQEKSVDGVIAIPGEDASKEDQIEGLVNNVKWQMSSDRKVGPLKQLQGLIWKQGYDNGDIKGHVYDDVMPALEQWRSVDGQKVYIYSSGSVEAQKLLFGQSLAGDLLKFIDGHFDTAVGAKQEASSYKAIVEKIGCAADEVLFLTDIVKEAEAARSAGLYVALVSREGNATLPEEATNTYPVIQTFSQLTVSNKRKTEPQEEQPAKVPKTNTNDVKTDTEASKVLPEKKEAEATDVEKMEVDDPVTEETTVKEVKVETVIEEVTDSKEIDAPVCEIEPIVIEEGVDQEKNEDKMETETVQGNDVAEKKADPKYDKTESKDVSEKEAPKETAGVPKYQAEDKEDSPVTDEALPSVITEIEEITSEKESLADVSEIIDGLEPVVEEPATATEMEDLQSVGEELEKECDEILSKMSDVSNLENIQVKPILKPIIEEPMEVENDVPNDVDKVLEAEVEMNASKDKSSEGKSPVEVSKEADISKETPENGTKTEETNGDKEKVDSKHKNEVKGVEKDDDKSAQSELVKKTQTEVKEALVAEVKETQTVENDDQAKKSVDAAKDKPVEADKVAEPKETIKSDEKEATVENKSEVKLNGDAMNGKPVNQNGVEKTNEIKARLSAENGKESNGSNGTNDAQKGQDESKVEEVSDIKVKTLAKEEPLPDPIKQATEA